ncbi:pyridoxal phosphate-dependent aminotransferase [Solibacillus sp. FSL H8-0538]|uniref:pyridoxal phosphate-dependent aminotransferase n=1 Tax=Solibacillus sp. FSL H8-0538 TaxID=2921400 RepID=UPI0030F663A6
MAFPIHGANYEALYKNFDLPLPTNVFDLSENVNCLGTPDSVHQMWPHLFSELTRYPHPEAEPLHSQLAMTHQLLNEQIVIGNGAAELLSTYANLFSGKKVILLHPTFSEYKETLTSAGATCIDIITDVHAHELPLEKINAAMKIASCLYICNPNNPTGKLLELDVLLSLIQTARQQQCHVLIDEAFMDWTDERNSVIPYVAQFEHVTVMRSMTKMYALAGIRLGYMVSHPITITRIKQKLPHWNVNALALSIGAQCLQEHTFRKRSIDVSKTQRMNITQFLREHGCIVLDSVANFVCFQLAQPEKTREFYFYCLTNGIVLRHTENYVGLNGQWLRIGLKKDEAMKAFQSIYLKWVVTL